MVQRRIHVSTSIIETVRTRIATGQWVPEQRLPSISQLAQEFGVGTGSVREAVKGLAALGVIRIEHGRGMFVAAARYVQVTPHEQFQVIGASSILALCEARRILEPELAAFAAERGSTAEHEAIQEQALEMERLVAAEQNFFAPDLQFHRLIALAAHNSVLERMMDGVNDLLSESRTITSMQPGMTPRAVRYHLLIAEAICEGNSLQARLLMLAHVNDAINSVLAWEGNTQSLQHSAERVELTPMLLMQRSLTPLL